MKSLPARSRLLEALAYDLETGIFRWKEKPNRRIYKGAQAGVLFRGYRVIRLDGVQYFAHRLAWLYVYARVPAKEIDHINGIADDNRIANLRDVTSSINHQNIRAAMSHSALGVLGVGKNPNGPNYRARINHIHLGTFSSVDEAYAAYLSAKRKLHEGCTI